MDSIYIFLELEIQEKTFFAFVTCFPYNFVGANQRKVDIKILSSIQCAISKD